MKKSATVAVVAALIAVFSTGTTRACTAFRVTAADGTRMCTRSMEFGVDIHYGIVVVPRALAYASPAIDRTPGVHWKNKYGFVGIDAFGDYRMVTDGINEKGLSLSVLWYEPGTRYQTVGPKERKNAMPYYLITSYILGNFSTVGQVRKALRGIRVYAAPLSKTNDTIFPLHLIVNGAGGGCIVIEYDNGVLHVYDDPLGILTNAPDFPWQVTNLRQYLGMTDTTVGGISFAGLKQRATGHGAGFWGLPGDYTPPSRFVKMAVLTHFAVQPKDAAGALVLSRHIIDTVDIPDGIIVDRNARGKIVSHETTQWTVFKDLTHRVMYLYTYDNPFSLRMVDLKKLSFTGARPLYIKLEGGGAVIMDVTGEAK